MVYLLGFGDPAESTSQSKILNPEYQQLLMHIALSWHADMHAFFKIDIAINNISISLITRLRVTSLNHHPYLWINTDLINLRLMRTIILVTD